MKKFLKTILWIGIASVGGFVLLFTAAYFSPDPFESTTFKKTPANAEEPTFKQLPYKPEADKRSYTI
jgi:hypothetical protein